MAPSDMPLLTMARPKPISAKIFISAQIYSNIVEVTLQSVIFL